jgi:hypothetical protein
MSIWPYAHRNVTVRAGLARVSAAGAVALNAGGINGGLPLSPMVAPFHFRPSSPTRNLPHAQTFLIMSSLAKELKERAERLFQQKHLGKALHDYRAKEEAIRLLTAKLRAERLAPAAASPRWRS